MTVLASFGLSGHFNLRVRRPDGRVRAEYDFDNLITDVGMDLFATAFVGGFGYSPIFTSCSVGTGNVPPAFSDSQLAAHLVTISFPRQFSNDVVIGTNSYVAAVPVKYWRRIQTCRFGTGQAAGNISEIGVGNGQTKLWNRQLILDAGGNPVTITILADEVLDVTFELRCYIDETVRPFSFNISGTTYTGTYVAYDIDTVPDLHQAINPNQQNLILESSESAAVITTTGTVTSINNTSSSVQAYVPGSWERAARASFALDRGNYATGIKSFIQQSPFSRFRYTFSPALMKTNVNTLTIDHKVSWARYTP